MNPLADALSTIGYVLDTPGAYTRGLLAGKPGERLDGREMLQSLGVVGENDTSQWDVGDVAGGIATALIDPLALGGIAAPLSLATKGGRAVASGALRKIPGVANEWDDVLRVADPGLGHNLSRLPNAARRAMGYVDDVPIDIPSTTNPMRMASGKAAMDVGTRTGDMNAAINSASLLEDAAPAMARRKYYRDAVNQSVGEVVESPQNLFGINIEPGMHAPRAAMSMADIRDLVYRSQKDKELLNKLLAISEPTRKQRAAISY